MSGVPNTKKEYVLISSDNSDADSVSTTDFTLRLGTPLDNVIKTDVVQVAIDYAPNILNGNNTVVLNEGMIVNNDPNATYGGQKSRTLTIPEGYYTVSSFCACVQKLLGNGYTVSSSSDGIIAIIYTLTEYDVYGVGGATGMYIRWAATTGMNSGIHPMTYPDPGNAIGYAQSTPFRLDFSDFPDVAAYFGQAGKERLDFSLTTTGIYGGFFAKGDPSSLPLGDPSSSIVFIQSRALGTDIRVANGNQGFWRMLLNNIDTNELTLTNSRVDTYTDFPRVLREIDIKLVNPDGSVVDNNGGRFAFVMEIVRRI